MRKVCENGVNNGLDRKNSIMWVWENQHPVMYWWFAFTSISLCSVYVLLFTSF